MVAVKGTKRPAVKKELKKQKPEKAPTSEEAEGIKPEGAEASTPEEALASKPEKAGATKPEEAKDTKINMGKCEVPMAGFGKKG